MTGWYIYTSGKSLSGVLVWVKIFTCLSVTIGLIRREGGVGGQREEKLQGGQDREVLSTSLPNNTIPPQAPRPSCPSPSPHPPSVPSPVALSFSVCAAQRRQRGNSLSSRFPFYGRSTLTSLCRRCLHFTTSRWNSPNNQDSWSYNNISLVHQAQPALINKHFEATPQHRDELKMSPLCLCQYLSLCWQSYFTHRGRWLV